jgi:ABC-type bacteriocin/lantibiotic exporter with double-glycine peptidase domain
MVLDYLGYEIDEPALAALCQTDPDGTSANDLILAANKLGFEAKKEYGNVLDIQKYLTRDVYPIVYVNLLAIDGLDITHAFVLETLTRGAVTVLDPWRGRRKIALPQFKIAWEKTRNLTIIVSKRS